MHNPEQVRESRETGSEVSDAAGKRSAELLKNPERSVEQSPDQRLEQAEKARTEAHKEALMSKEAGTERTEKESTSSPRSIHKITDLEKRQAYKQTMKRVQSELSLPARTFSKIIHAPFIEKSSEIIGSSLARPNAILAGSFTALVMVSIIYVVARTYGYRLSGFETIATFVLGWIIGIVFDYVKVMATGKR